MSGETMKIKFIEKWKFTIRGRAVPVIRAADITSDGLVQTLHLVGEIQDRPNSLVSTWDGRGYEKSPGVKMITQIDEKGLSKLVYIVSEAGRTINLFTEPWPFPNHEETIGKAATVDDIASALDLGKSMRNLLIGLLIGLAVGTFFLGPMVQAMMK
jgi:hypothetical protein